MLFTLQVTLSPGLGRPVDATRRTTLMLGFCNHTCCLSRIRSDKMTEM